MEERVKALEDLKLKFEGAANAVKAANAAIGLGVFVLVSTIIAFVWNYAAQTRDVAHHDKAIAEIKISLDVVAKRLQAWEDKGFRHVGMIPYDGEISEFKDNVLVITQGGKNPRKFTVRKDAQISLDGKAIAVANLASLKGFHVWTFLVEPDDNEIGVIHVERPPQKK